MKMEKEITVKVNCNYEKLHKDLLVQGFNIIEEYNLNDVYLVNNDVDIFSINTLDLLKQCILVRDVVGITKKLVYKYKKYDNNENILEQGKTECEIVDINSAVEFMKKINYKELIKIFDKCIVYTDNNIEIIVQLVNDKYVFIEMEDKADHINKHFVNIEEMIQLLKNIKLIMIIQIILLRKQ
jgi:predicted adenylyl cyclase CyaB